MSLKLVRLELARTQEFPEGDPHHGYEIRMPLSSNGHIDEKAYKASAQLCTVRHFRPDDTDKRGQLVHTKGGWAISYLPGDADDEPVLKLGSHVFRTGEYVAIVERDGGEQVFRVVSIGDVPLHA